jgi:hypothetical protein
MSSFLRGMVILPQRTDLTQAANADCLQFAALLTHGDDCTQM